jgi:predicted DNA-binding transcriptional regulator YafY
MRNKSHEPSKPQPGKPNARWGQERRLAFIDFRLQWEGRLNRSHLIQFFGISVPQASIDLAHYRELAPQNLSYDHSSRTYLVAEGFHPISAESNPKRYLDELLALESGILETTDSFIGWRPPVGVTTHPYRSVDARTLAALLKAIRAGSCVEIRYQSMSSEPGLRTISPHALGNDGFRWHVRAFCHKRQEYRDFVLGRILEIKEVETPGIRGDNDTEWHTILTLVLIPHPRHDEAKRRVIELDYGMEGGEVSLPCRQALLYYTLKRLGLSSKRDEKSPEEQQIDLKNRAELEPYLQKIKS